MDIHAFTDTLGFPFVYPWISEDIHALTRYGFSIQGQQGTWMFQPSPSCRRIALEGNIPPSRQTNLI